VTKFGDKYDLNVRYKNIYTSISPNKSQLSESEVETWYETIWEECSDACLTLASTNDKTYPSLFIRGICSLSPQDNVTTEEIIFGKTPSVIIKKLLNWSLPVQLFPLMNRDKASLLCDFLRAGIDRAADEKTSFDTLNGAAVLIAFELATIYNLMIDDCPTINFSEYDGLTDYIVFDVATQIKLVKSSNSMLCDVMNTFNEMQQDLEVNLTEKYTLEDKICAIATSDDVSTAFYYHLLLETINDTDVQRLAQKALNLLFPDSTALLFFVKENLTTSREYAQTTSALDKFDDMKTELYNDMFSGIYTAGIYCIELLAGVFNVDFADD
jgi:hypothetical protein